MLADSKVIDIVDHFGHVLYPFGFARQEPLPDRSTWTLADPWIHEAVESYQHLNGSAATELIAAHYPQRLTPEMRVDGIVGPAFRELLQAERCGCRDYGPEGILHDEEDALPAVGTGGWKRCHGIGEFHAAVVSINNNPPAHLAPHFPEILRRVNQAEDEIGLRFYWTGPGCPAEMRSPISSPVNIDFSFVNSSNGWIGLAVLGGVQSCTGRIWCRYLASYCSNCAPAVKIAQWVTLIKHELTHNKGSGHTNGGVMNATIRSGLPTSWRGDVLWPWLVTRFGGVPIPGDGPDPEPEPPDPQPPTPDTPIWLEMMRQMVEHDRQLRDLDRRVRTLET